MPGGDSNMKRTRGSSYFLGDQRAVVGSLRVTGRRYFGKQIQVTPTKQNLGTFKEEISDLHHRPFCMSPPGHNACSTLQERRKAFPFLLTLAPYLIFALLKPLLMCFSNGLDLSIV